MSDFQSLGLSNTLLRAVEAEGYTTPTPVQQQSIPPLLEGRDVLGVAQTGTGKTAAFALPVLQIMNRKKPQGKRFIRALILSPTRELAAQIDERFAAYSEHMDLRHRVIFGGVNQNPQVRALQKGLDILVATPGRLLDLIGQGHIDITRVEFFVLDEADRMLDMGFFPDVLWIFERTVNREQTLLFSATFPQEVLDAAEEFLNNPVHVMSEDLEVEVPEIEQYAIKVGRANKLWALGRIIGSAGGDSQILIFTNTKRMVELIVERLGKFRFRAVGLHGDMPQNKRERVLDSFRDGSETVSYTHLTLPTKA